MERHSSIVTLTCGVILAVSFWMTVWGVIGAILAIPLTSMVMIILAEIPATRPIAVMMSGDGEV